MQNLAFLLAADEADTNPLLPAIYDIVWSIIPFALVLLLFWRVVLPRLQKTLDERSEAIEGGILRAESAQEEAKESLEKYNALLAEARAEASAIKEQARLEGSHILQEIKTAAQNEAERLTASAQSQIESERQQAVQSLRREVGEVAIDMAAAVVQERLSNDKQAAAVVENLLAELSSNDSRTTSKVRKKSSGERKAE